jgi:hypothetical protein
MFVLLEESAETIVSADAQTCDCGGTGDWLGQRMLGVGVRDTPMRLVTVMVLFVLAQGVQQVAGSVLLSGMWGWVDAVHWHCLAVTVSRC